MASLWGGLGRQYLPLDRALGGAPDIHFVWKEKWPEVRICEDSRAGSKDLEGGRLGRRLSVKAACGGTKGNTCKIGTSLSLFQFLSEGNHTG